MLRIDELKIAPTIPHRLDIKKTLKVYYQWMSQWVLMPFQWLLLRLPRGFTIPLLAVAFVYFFYLFPALVQVVIPLLLLKIGQFVAYLGHQIGSTELHPLFKFILLVIVAAIVTVTPIISSLLTLSIALFGIFSSYWIAGNTYRIYRRLVAKQDEAPVPLLPAHTSDMEASSDNPLAGYKKIGIILSGGGAKGAYQAGAMQAIYEFLEEHNAHRKVQMIAGTSIGSWNALFWLAGLIKSKTGGPGPLERWWSQVNVQNIILPIAYVPTRQNYFLSNEPWQETFNALFKDTSAGKQLLYHIENPDATDAIKFYFTHSNIAKAHLAFTTNRNDWDNVTANLPNHRPRPVILREMYRVAESLRDIRRGVFCSMDIPPLFQYTSIDNDYFEDGGVIDNLPIRFGTEIEECDLLFILPLNASFERKVDTRSVIKRLARVTEIRQGVLERNSFKMVYLYNELASLRKKVEELEGTLSSEQPRGGEQQPAPTTTLSENKMANRALARKHSVVNVFSICPAPELKINTTEFWKTREAGEAFQFMYKVTKNELKKFPQLVNSSQIRMALVCPDEENCPVNREQTNDPLSDKLGVDAAFADKPISKVADDMPYKVTYFKDF